MIGKATLALVAVLGFASPVLAQSWDPDIGTGNLVTFNNGTTAAQIPAPQNGRNAYAMVPHSGEVSSGYEELLKTH